MGAAYLRPYDSRRMRAVERAGATSPLRQHALSIEDGLLAWAEITPSLVLNCPSAMASNNSKPYQSRFIHAAGFRIPDTLVTTEVEAALEFWERHGDIIYKSVSGIRSIVSRLKDSDRTDYRISQTVQLSSRSTSRATTGASTSSETTYSRAKSSPRRMIIGTPVGRETAWRSMPESCRRT